MNINPSDMDVRQGYSLAENPAATQPQSASQAAAATQGSSETATAQQQSETTDARSLAAQESADRATAREAAKKLEEQLKNADTGYKIRVLDDSMSSVQVEIVDQKSNKVLRQIPQDEVLKLAASMKSMTGVLVNKPT